MKSTISETESILSLESTFSLPLNQLICSRVNKSRKILDIGCGSASLGISLYKEGNIELYVGIDNDARKIEAAKRHSSSPHAPFVIKLADITQINLPSNFFDVVVSVMAVHDFFSVTLLERIHSSLTINGKVCLIDLDITYAPRESFSSARKCSDSFISKYLSRQQFSQWLSAAGRLYDHPEMVEHINDFTRPLLTMAEYLSHWSKLFLIVEALEIWPGVYFIHLAK